METTRDIYLHGSLGKKFGKKHRLSSTSIKDTVRGLATVLQNGFEDIIRNGNWHVTTGQRVTKSDKPHKTDNFRSEDEVELNLTESEIHIFPAIAGAGGKSGIFQIIIGIILIVVCWWNPVGWIGAGTLLSSSAAAAGIMMGVSMVLAGAMSLMTKAPKITNYDSANSANNRPSFIFNGVVNVQEQGGPVPLVYGRHLTGSTVISSGIEVLQI